MVINEGKEKELRGEDIPNKKKEERNSKINSEQRKQR